MKGGSVVIVESPAKATTISRYLGNGYTVLASYGHVRDLLSKSGSVDPDHDFKMIWEEKSHKHIADILQAVDGSSSVFLATDPDREGEAIAWHIAQLIQAKYGSKMPPLYRVTFHEITKNAILSAVEHPKDIDPLLVEAYLARRALDYLVGYSLSPVLWQKLPGSRSAGRVQSVALRLIVEREQEIEAFKSQEYWTVDGLFQFEKAVPFQARLYTFEGKKLEKLDIANESQAKDIAKSLKVKNYAVLSVEEKKVRRMPAPPFTTSTLQQEASRKLGFGASRTMKTAQTLYEGIQIQGETTGLITYMRTDSVVLSQEAITHFRKFIQKNYGDAYLPNQARVYKTKTKNAQEAHEAIRPTDITRRPEDMAEFLNKDQLALYDLIWKRAISSQMENAVFNQVTADISDEALAKKTIFRAVGTTQIFDGFLKVYQEGSDDADDKGDQLSDEPKLPPLKTGQSLNLKDVMTGQHFTQPPAHFTEASLVKKLEELGIGRPSTYASLIQVLQDRGYAVLEKRQFIPSDRGRIVTAFLVNFCKKYLEYDFTAHLEDELDDISNGKLDWKKVMKDFWSDFSPTVSQMKSLAFTEVTQVLERELDSFLFHGHDKQCDKCHEGIMELRLGKFGAFLGCNRYPECSNRYPVGRDANDSPAFEPVILGTDDEGSVISLRQGPYGFYIQIENPHDQNDVKETKPSKRRKKALVKRVGIPTTMDPLNITLTEALLLKSLPKDLGQFEGNPVLINTGRFGPYVKCGDILASIPKSLNFLEISFDQAVKLIQEKREKKNAKTATKPKLTKAVSKQKVVKTAKKPAVKTKRQAEE